MKADGTSCLLSELQVLPSGVVVWVHRLLRTLWKFWILSIGNVCGPTFHLDFMALMVKKPFILHPFILHPFFLPKESGTKCNRISSVVFWDKWASFLRKVTPRKEWGREEMIHVISMSRRNTFILGKERTRKRMLYPKKTTFIFSMTHTVQN